MFSKAANLSEGSTGSKRGAQWHNPVYNTTQNSLHTKKIHILNPTDNSDQQWDALPQTERPAVDSVKAKSLSSIK